MKWLAKLFNTEGQGLRAACLVAVLGFVAYCGTNVGHPSFMGAQDQARNAALRHTLQTVRLAIEQYATDHGGTLPTAANWVSELAEGKHNYLPGNRLPRTSWSKREQSAVIPVPKAWATPPADGQLLGQGHMPADSPRNDHDYGAILYFPQREDKRLVLIGIGKEKGEAKVIQQ